MSGYGFQADFDTQATNPIQQQSNPWGSIAGIGAGVSAINPFVGAGIMGLSGLFQGLASMFGGGAKKKLRGQLQGELGKSLINPTGFIDNINLAMAPQNAANAAHFSKRLGLSSPLAQAGIAKQQGSMFASLFNQIQMAKAQMESQRDQNIFGMLSGLV